MLFSVVAVTEDGGCRLGLDLDAVDQAWQELQSNVPFVDRCGSLSVRGQRRWRPEATAHRRRVGEAALRQWLQAACGSIASLGDSAGATVTASAHGRVGLVGREP